MEMDQGMDGPGYGHPLKSVQQEHLLGIKFPIFSPGTLLVLDVLLQIVQFLPVHPEKRETSSLQSAEGKM